MVPSTPLALRMPQAPAGSRGTWVGGDGSWDKGLEQVSEGTGAAESIRFTMQQGGARRAGAVMLRGRSLGDSRCFPCVWQRWV